LSATVLLITPPFTQLNTPYPATAYLKGFLNTKNISAFQADLGIEVILQVFNKNGLLKIFEILSTQHADNPHVHSYLSLSNDYIDTIDHVILFLQGKAPTLAHRIAAGGFLPEGARFDQYDNVDWAFGNMGITEKAKYMCTMYLEDIADIITTYIDPHFGFSRYAERLGRSANSFDELYQHLHNPFSFFDSILIELIEQHIQKQQPKLLAISVPFPGNLFAGFRCAQYVKKNYPHIKTVLGGGFANTELRAVSDIRVFEFFDFITLDDGEAPMEQLIRLIENNISLQELKRTFTVVNNQVVYFNNSACSDYKQFETGTPDYSDLLLDKYIAAIEVINPMHSLWSNGRWNKLTMAHGCYWGKCTFCDISLNYIQAYEPLTAAVICNRMEQIMAQTGETGFHFVDEAAPPSLMRAVALEIIKRKLVVSWWTNIRFEKSFTRDLCLLLKASGCIGVSGGLEVASDRLLELIQKGVTLEQVARVNKNFTDAGIMVHAYLMYGFPTQTVQETIDSLEMVRQLFEAGILQSGFWHQFAMTAHSPVGLKPQDFSVSIVNNQPGSFANNDLHHIDPTGADHSLFSEGLKISLLNFMEGAGFDKPVHTWFEHKMPATTIPPTFINTILFNEPPFIPKNEHKVVFIGNAPRISFYAKTKKGVTYQMATLIFSTKNGEYEIKLNREQAVWLAAMLELAGVNKNSIFTIQQIKENYEQSGLQNFELFWNNPPINELFEAGLLHL
jgi:hypothetical protein